MAHHVRLDGMCLPLFPLSRLAVLTAPTREELQASPGRGSSQANCQRIADAKALKGERVISVLKGAEPESRHTE